MVVVVVVVFAVLVVRSEQPAVIYCNNHCVNLDSAVGTLAILIMIILCIMSM